MGFDDLLGFALLGWLVAFGFLGFGLMWFRWLVAGLGWVCDFGLAVIFRSCEGWYNIDSCCFV